jgi:hypothetical protein
VLFSLTNSFCLTLYSPLFSLRVKEKIREKTGVLKEKKKQEPNVVCDFTTWREQEQWAGQDWLLVTGR